MAIAPRQTESVEDSELAYFVGSLAGTVYKARYEKTETGLDIYLEYVDGRVSLLMSVAGIGTYAPETQIQ